MKKLSLFLVLIIAVGTLSSAFAEQTVITTVVPNEHMLNLSLGEGGTLNVNGNKLTGDAYLSINHHDRVVIKVMPVWGYKLETATVSSDYGVSLQGNSIVVDQMVQDLTVKIAFIRALLLRLPSSLTEIEDEAFAGSSVEQVICPNGMTTIGQRAFANCMQLTHVVMPASITSISSNAFEGCSDLIIVGPYGSYAQTFAQSIGAEFEVLLNN